MSTASVTIDRSLARQALAGRPASQPASSAPAAGKGDPLLSFETLVDAVNPLQHLPVVSTLYRSATGDGIGAAARLAGGFLFGGPLGLLAGAATVAFEAATGASVEEQARTAAGRVAAAFSGSEGEERTPAPALPWLAAPAPAGGRDPGTPSDATLERALAKATAATGQAPGGAGSGGMQTGDAVRVGPAAPDPEAVARLYALESTRPGGAGGRHR